MRQRLLDRMAQSPAATVGLYFRVVSGRDSLLVNPDVRMHAAGTVTIPVMIQVFRDAEDDRFRLTDSLLITNRFRSAVGDSWYDLVPSQDADTTLYARTGARVPIRQMLDYMVTQSSNLAGNTLLDLVGAARTRATMHTFGADSFFLRRGVQDLAAHREGLNNTATARDLGVVLAAVAESRAASDTACQEMIEILTHEGFGEGIPAGLPPATRVAHRPTWITEFEHDAAIVYPEHAPAYVLVVLTTGIVDRSEANRLIADLSRIVYGAVTSS